MAFIDDMRAAGRTVESICRVLSSQGCQIAARTYRSWKQANRPVSTRTLSDAVTTDALLATVGTPEGLYGRRHVRPRATPVCCAGSCPTPPSPRLNGTDMTTTCEHGSPLGKSVLRVLRSLHQELRRAIPDVYKGWRELSKAAFADGALTPRQRS